MITVDSFFSSTMATVDAVITNFVSQAYTHFVQANAGLITLLFTVYVMYLGYQFVTHSHHLHLQAVMKHIITLLIVYALVMNWKLYHLFIYNIFTNEPANISQVMVNSAGQWHGGDNLIRLMDLLYGSVINATTSFFAQANFSGAGLAFIVYAGIVFVIGSLMCAYALLLFIYAKMMMAVALALGPIFILFLLWDSTKNLFSAWLSMLMTLALIPIVTSAVLVLMLSVINVTLPQLNQPTAQLQFYGIVPFLGLTLATTMILSQVLSICSSLAGGIRIAGLSTGADIANKAFERSGAKALGSAVMSRMSRSSHNRFGGHSS